MSLFLISKSYFLESDEEAGGGDGDKREEEAKVLLQSIELTEGKGVDERNSTTEELDDGGQLEPLESTLPPEDKVDDQTNISSERAQINDDTQEFPVHGPSPSPQGKRSKISNTVKRKKRIGNDIWNYRQKRRSPRKHPGRSSNLRNGQSLTLKSEKVGNDRKKMKVSNESSQFSPFVRKEEPLKCPYCLAVYHGTDELIQHFATCISHNKCERGRAENAAIQQLPDDRHVEKLSPQESDNSTHKKSYHKKLECSKCHASFKYLHILKKHMILHEDIGRPWKCSTCSCTFATLSHLRRHENQLHGSGKVLGTKNTSVPKHHRHPIKEEYRRSLPENKLVPGNIPKEKKNRAFKNKKSYRFKCSICNMLMSDQSRLRKHNRRVHTEGADKLWKCSGCRSFFKKSSHLRIHENRVHNRTPGLTKVPCNVCGKLFNNTSKIDSHMHTHSSERQLKCPLCPGKFKLKSHATRHLRVVHGKMSAVALKLLQSSTPEATSSLAPLKNIQSTKGTAETAKSACKICGKVFIPSELAIHVLSHTGGGRLFKCLVCNNQYKCKFNAVRHLRNVHGRAKPTEILRLVESFDNPKDEASSKSENTDIARKLRPCTVDLIRCDDLISTYIKPTTDAGVDTDENLGDCAKSSNSGVESVGRNPEAGNNSRMKRKQSNFSIKTIPGYQRGWVFRNLKEGRKIIPAVKNIAEMGLGSENKLAVVEPPSQNTGMAEQKKTNSEDVIDATSQSQLQEPPNIDVSSGDQNQAEAAVFSEAIKNKTEAENEQEGRHIYRCPFCFVPFVTAALLIAHLPAHTAELHKQTNAVSPNDNKIHPKKEAIVEDLPTTHEGSEATVEASILNPAKPKLPGVAHRKDSKPYKCHHCNYSCLANQTLQYHIKQHSEKGRPFRCSKCNYTFTSFRSLRTHVGRFHKGSKSLHAAPIHKCQHCTYSSKAWQRLRQHMELHKEEGRPFKCVKCNFTFTTFKSLRIHEGHFHKRSQSLQVAAAPIVHKCQSCNYSTVILRDWENHVSSHQTVILIRKPFKCSVCSSCFQNLKELRIHSRSVHCHGNSQGENAALPIRFHYIPTMIMSKTPKYKNMKTSQPMEDN